MAQKAGTALKAKNASESTCTDRRYLRSRKMIYTALASLIEERGVDGFTVGDLSERADLNRSTFYSHFKDKDDVICRYEDEFLAELSQVEATLAEVTPEQLADAILEFEPLPTLVGLFDFLREHGTMLRALLGPKGDIAFQHRLMDTLCDTLMSCVLDPKYTRDKSLIVDYYVSYFTSAALGVVGRWLGGGMRESSKEMAIILMRVSFLRPGDPIDTGGLEND
ncbi:MAG: TetR/AcrR family transcriptional regulator [Coriobacteriales bacterium]|jgi:AcrR family transcriptional regulator